MNPESITSRTGFNSVFLTFQEVIVEAAAVPFQEVEGRERKHDLVDTHLSAWGRTSKPNVHNGLLRFPGEACSRVKQVR